jgi:hypothetical protein
MILSSLIKKTDSELAKMGKDEISKSSGACLVLGKIIYALSLLMPNDTTLAKYIASMIGDSAKDIPRASFSIAVCAAFIGEGAGKYSEKVFDKTAARVLAVASAIYNLLTKAVEDKREMTIGKETFVMDETRADGYRVQVSVIINEGDKSTMQSRLESIRDALKPAKAKGEGGEGGEGEDKSEGGDVLPLEVQALDALKAFAVALGKATFDKVQFKALNAAFAEVSALMKVKGKAAKEAPKATGEMEGATFVPSAPVAGGEKSPTAKAA